MHALVLRLSAQTLRHLRGDRDLQDVAVRSGLALEMWELWEQGQQFPGKDQIPALLQGLGCTPEELEATFLLAAQTRQEWQRAERLQDTGIEVFDQLVGEVAAVLYQQQTILDSLEEFADLEEFQALKQLFRDQARSRKGR